MATIKLSNQRITSLTCAASKRQEFFRDERSPWLAVKVTGTGLKSYVFESSFHGQTIRITIGDVRNWLLQQAREHAHELKTMCDKGIDPRQHMAAVLNKAELDRREMKRQKSTLGEAWHVYCASRRHLWSQRYYDNHIRFAHPGRVPKKVGKGMTKPGALHQLMPLKLKDISKDTVARWLRSERRTRPTNALMCFDLLRAFANWSKDCADYQGLLDPTLFSSRLVLDELPRRRAREDDVLQREHLRKWFAAVRAQSPLCSTYLQALLLTGARKNEMAALQWTDVNLDFRQMTIRDKEDSRGGEDGFRTIPIPSYLCHLLRTMPRTPNSPYVFASRRSRSGYISEARFAHAVVLASAGLPGVTLHGLRKSFATLSEWVEMPLGITAQIMGHRPSATAEKHYKRRPVDLLRHWHDKLEAWILREAGIDLDPDRYQDEQPFKRVA